MGRIKTGGRGFEFSYQEYRDALADTMAELDEMASKRKEEQMTVRRDIYECRDTEKGLQREDR